MKKEKRKKIRPAQKQTPPDQHKKMKPLPEVEKPTSRIKGKLEGKVAIVTGGDSGIGQAVAVNFANEGADVVVIYLKERSDADQTRRLVENKGKKCLLISRDIGEEKICKSAIKKTLSAEIMNV